MKSAAVQLSCFGFFFLIFQVQSTFCFVSWLPPSIGERCERNFHHLVSPATIQKQLFTLTQPISGVRLLIGRCFRVPWQVCHFHCWSGMIPLCFVKLRFVKLYNCDSVSSTLIVATHTSRETRQKAGGDDSRTTISASRSSVLSQACLVFPCFCSLSPLLKRG